MPREKEGYRDVLERLLERFPGRETISIAEASAYLGVWRGTLLSDGAFPAKRVGGNKHSGRIIIPLPLLARWMVP